MGIWSYHWQVVDEAVEELWRDARHRVAHRRGEWQVSRQQIPVVIDEPLPLVLSLQHTFGQRRPA